VAKPFRRKGLTVKLLEAAIKYVEEKGGSMVEGYPTDSAKAQPDPFVYTGLASSFRRAGFVEVLRRSKSRLIMRYVIGKKKK
jgi:GNAT superfamily N-acetyltransferase